MSQFKKLGCLVACCAALAVGCGDDDKGKEADLLDTGGDSCYLAEESRCETFDGAGLFCEGVLGGVDQACPTDHVEGTCKYTDEGTATTVTYYKLADGSAWSDDFGNAQDDCDSYDGSTYTAK